MAITTLPAALRPTTTLAPLVVNLDTADMPLLTHMLQLTAGHHPQLHIECGNLQLLRTQGVCEVVSQLLALHQTGATIYLRNVAPALLRALRLLQLEGLFSLAAQQVELTILSTDPTLPEQCVAAELAYYRQADFCQPTVAEQQVWQYKQEQYEALHPGSTFPGRYDSSLFDRYLLEARGYSLHRYMAVHLTTLAWAWWAAQVDFHRPYQFYSLAAYQLRGGQKLYGFIIRALRRQLDWGDAE